MENFLNEISSRLENQSLKLAYDIQSDHKKLISNSYSCMSNCYLQPSESITNCGKCADECQVRVRRAQYEIQEYIKSLQSQFTNCTHACGLHSARYESAELKACVNQCTDTSIKKFDDVSTAAKSIIRKYNI